MIEPTITVMNNETKENIYQAKVTWEEPPVDLQRVINTASSLRGTKQSVS